MSKRKTTTTRKKAPAKRAQDAAPKSEQAPVAERPILDVISDIRSGVITGKSLSVPDRRQCVQFLRCEGMSIAEIARLLGFSDRNISRDWAAIQEENAIEPDPRLRGRIAGQLMLDVDAARTELRRAARQSDARPSDRIEAAKALIDIECKKIERLQSLGILPNSSSLHHTHSFGDAEVPSISEMSEQARSILAIADETGHAEIGRELRKACQELKRIGLADAVGRAAANLGKEGREDV